MSHEQIAEGEHQTAGSLSDARQRCGPVRPARRPARWMHLLPDGRPVQQSPRSGGALAQPGPGLLRIPGRDFPWRPGTAGVHQGTRRLRHLDQSRPEEPSAGHGQLPRIRHRRLSRRGAQVRDQGRDRRHRTAPPVRCGDSQAAVEPTTITAGRRAVIRALADRGRCRDLN